MRRGCVRTALMCGCIFVNGSWRLECVGLVPKRPRSRCRVCLLPESRRRPTNHVYRRLTSGQVIQPHFPILDDRRFSARDRRIPPDQFLTPIIRFPRFTLPYKTFLINWTVFFSSSLLPVTGTGRTPEYGRHHPWKSVASPK